MNRYDKRVSFMLAMCIAISMAANATGTNAAMLDSSGELEEMGITPLGNEDVTTQVGLEVKTNLQAEIVNADAMSLREVYVSILSNKIDVDSMFIKDKDGNNILQDASLIGSNKVRMVTCEDINANEIYIVGGGGLQDKVVDMKDILDDAKYYYDKDDLGLTYTQETSTFKVWAPTAEKVYLTLYNDAADTEGKDVLMNREGCGVWSDKIDEDLDGKFYTYKVVFPDGTINEAVDPYAKGVSINGEKSAIIDLSKTNPLGFESSKGPDIQSSADAIVYEMHVRDMSSQKGNNFEHEGKYLALTETGRTTADGSAIGLDHLKELGITHVQIQPVYDYQTVDELNPEASYNWGYDPQNYNVPEGSYSTDPSDPYCRVNEFKQMVQAMHDNNIGVIMDVVYNHTYNTEGCLNKIVPGYYYRTADDGSFTNGSGCGNEIASEKPMVRKYIKDSVKYWAEEYNIDGFRFDLMGIIDKDTMKQIVSELRNEVNPNIIIYGEPWSGGTSGLASSNQTLKGTQKGYNFGVFNDNLRNAIKGDSDGNGKGFATGASNKESEIVEGAQGAINTIAQDPTEVVSYVTAHDNLNLWDKVIKCMGYDAINPYACITEDNVLDNEAVKRDLLANGIVLTSQGIAFMHSGEEILRTKFGDHNSYKSPDEINMVRWENKDIYKDVFDFYKGLIELRKNHPAFRMTSANMVKDKFNAYVEKDGVVAFTLGSHANGDIWNNIVVIYNANETSKTVDLPVKGNWNIVVDDKKAGTSTIETLHNTATVEVKPISMMVLYDSSEAYEQTPTSIKVPQDKIVIEKGKGMVLKATLNDQHDAVISDAKLEYTSSDEDVVAVNSSGSLTAKMAGKAIITISIGEISKNIEIEVVDKLEAAKLEIKSDRDYVYTDNTMQLSCEAYDSLGNEMLGADIKWSVDDRSIAAIDSHGVLKGLKEGMVTVTASSGNITVSKMINVKAYEKRYLVFEYEREDKDYTDWNLWVWGTGAKDNQIDYKYIKDDKAVFEIELGPEATAVGYIIRKGTDWNTCKQDVTSDRYIYMDASDVITKATVYEMTNEPNIRTTLKAPELNPETGSIRFSYRDNALFKSYEMNSIDKVQIELNGELYDMIYDTENEIFMYDYAVPSADNQKINYKYVITYKDGIVKTALDSKNSNVENGLSVFEYKKLNVKINASINKDRLYTSESTILVVDVDTSGEKEEVRIKNIYADLSELGLNNKVEIDTSVMKLALTANEEVSGVKQIPIKAYDQYGNVYTTEVSINVEPKSADKFDWDESIIYFMLTDRFNNGDKSNDSPNGVTYDKNSLKTYHGGDFKGVIEKLDYLKSLGVNTIWITPIVEQINQSIDGASAYHGYWAKDFEVLNPHLGTMDDLKALIDGAHDRDMKIMVDVVLNHTGYGMKDNPKYEGMLRNDGSTDTVYGEVAGLPDFITEEPEVRNKIIKWQSDWITKCITEKGGTIDYFRIDTVKHLDKATLEAFKAKLSEVKPDFRTIGEAWLNGSDLNAYLNRGLVDGVLNFDFKSIAKDFVEGKVDSAEAALEELNNNSASNATYGNFLGSHDENGFLYTIGMDNIAGLKVAATLQATSKGQPVIYYGEELGLSGENDTYENRYDMAWDKVKNNDILDHYKKIYNIRSKYSKVLAKGTRTKIQGSDNDGYIVFERAYEGESIIVAVNNKDAKSITINMPEGIKGMVKDEYSRKSYEVKDGKVTVELPAGDDGGTVILNVSNNVPITPEPSVTPEPNVTPEPSVIPEQSPIPTVNPVTSDDDDDDITTKPSSANNDNNNSSSEASSNNSDSSSDTKDNQHNTITNTVVNIKKFKDVPSTHWAKKYIDALVSKDIIKGKTENVFMPNQTITRAEMAAIIARCIKDEVTATETFKDIDADAWYSRDIAVLKKLGIVTGDYDGKFNPNAKITRAELSAILVRFYAYMTNNPAEAIDESITIEFKDSADIPKWATAYIAKCSRLGIIGGNNDARVLPIKNATRAEAAKMIYMLLDCIEK